MKFETKFDMGQIVHVISQTRASKVLEPCPTCLGEGCIPVRGESFVCPKCNGSKNVTQTAYVWHVAESSTVGQIEICTSRETLDDAETDVRYMLRATGIGSGRVYDEHELWAGTREEAQAEADRRNIEDIR
jgi:hypothetical protein